MVPTRSLALIALAAAGLGSASCNSTPTNSNNCGSGTAPALAGSYTLSSYQFGTRTYTVPPASGVLYLTTFKYADSLYIPASVGDTLTADSGTYQVVGSECILLMSQAGKRNFSGTFKVAESPTDTTFRMDGNDSLHVIISIWSRQ